MKSVTIVIKGLKCDAPGCLYQQDEPHSTNYAEWKRWLNAPCPVCGAPLLTRADLDTMRVMLVVVRIINRITWPLAMIETLLRHKPVVYDLGMDGSGRVNPKKVGEQ